VSEPPSGCANLIDVTIGEREGVTLDEPAGNATTPRPSTRRLARHA